MPRGQLLTEKESKAYTARRIDELEAEGKIDKEFAQQLREQYDAEIPNTTTRDR